ncbi:MAG: MBL fold metallo-hydrolase [Pseudomonadales bacterium]|nr:MBL fold metallo-hydrolase [Pseudomonadales bacterium]
MYSDSIHNRKERLSSKGSVYREGEFQNLVPTQSNSGIGSILKSYLLEKSDISRPTVNIPLAQIQGKDLHAGSSTEIFRLGHSSVLIRLDGGFWLTDPVFSERASPVQWAGPKRFHPVPVALESIPELEGVLISHDHYDHLDKGTIKALHPKVKRFYVPIGVGSYLIEWGVPEHKIEELDWWQSVFSGTVEIVATPAQHFSGRGLFDRNQTLWASWVLIGQKERLFFSGDSGYFPGFKQIGENYGPFDLTLIETGAYNAHWPGVHMQPEHSIQAHMDLKGKLMIPIHNSTFDLALHAWYEPLERVTQLARELNQQLLTPRIGEGITLGQPRQQYAWWRELEQEAFPAHCDNQVAFSEKNAIHERQSEPRTEWAFTPGDNCST